MEHHCVTRREELAANLVAVKDRVARACAAVGRAADEVTLIAVTKTFPASDVRLLAGLGVENVGENKDAEAAEKHAACLDLALTWHFVGQLQRNKARSVASYADVVHSIDRLAVVAALSAGAQSAGRQLTALVQVSLDAVAGSGRGGVPPGLAVELADAVAVSPGLHLGGVMAVAPLGGDGGAAFAVLERVAAQIRNGHPDAGIVSAGMSADLEAAIEHGATHVRIGTALLGHRPSPFG
jgi:pyridoxal phosphate enzyme (YggS family)